VILNPTLRSQIQSAMTQVNYAPFFFYDLDALFQRAQRLMQTKIKLWYAVKANPLSKVIQTLDKTGFAFDVASVGELEQVLTCGVTAEKILHTGPAKSYAQFKHFIFQGIRIFVLESHQQVYDVQRAAQEAKAIVQAVLRVQLRWEGEQDNILGGSQLTPFGLLPEDWHGLRLTDFPNIDFKGLHTFQWGNITDAKALKHIWQTLLSPLQKLAQRLALPIRVLDLGGGLGIPYAGQQERLSWERVEIILSGIQQQLPNTEIWMELGRYVVGEIGYYIAPVVDRKTCGGKELLVLEGGINHLLRPVLSGQAFPVNLLRDSDAPQQDFQLHGPLCTAIDVLGTHALPGDIQIGDNLVFFHCGAYGFTESMPLFLCHTLPGEVVWQDGKADMIREPAPAATWLK